MHKAVESWFERNGWTPFDFQRAAWRAYAAGRSGLVHAPTGVGKTYAVWLGPVMERLASGPEPRARQSEPGAQARRQKRSTCDPLRVLWITPLRALAADTVESLRRPVEDLGLPWSIELRTGDTSQALRARQNERLPTALVTTPESLTLFLTRASTRERFATLRCVIVDEWHELLATKRSVQAELALARLRSWYPDLRVWGLSATLGNLDQALRVLMGEGTRAAASVQSKVQNPKPRIDAPVLISGQMPKAYAVDTLIPDDIGCFPWSGHLGVRCIDGVLDALERYRSTLLFTNTRSQAEIWFRSLQRARPEWIGQMALHHGSLDRELRNKVEDLLRAGALRCVVCTSSLDLGVDFSPVDQVIQLGSPKGIARLMQRAGRSGHQPGALSRVLCVPTHAFELVEFAAARRAVGRRDVEPREPLRKPLDVLVQHLVTCALGGGFNEAELFDEVRTSYAYRDLTRTEWGWALDFVTRGGEALKTYEQHARIKLVEGRYIVTSRMVEKMHRMSIGTITSDTMMNVRFVSGGILGTIEESFIGRLAPGDAFVFAGRTLELVRVRENTAYVRNTTVSNGIVPRWNGGRFPLSTRLAAAVRERLDEAHRGVFDDPEMQAVRPLLELQARSSILPRPGELLIEEVRSREGWHFYLYPFEGRSAHEGLASLLAYRLSQQAPRAIHVSANDYGIELLCPTELRIDAANWTALLSTDRLVEDLLACLNVTQLARRQFRDIARIAGLVFAGYPGAPKLSRHLQASSELFFDVFSEFDAGNLLLDQARREVLKQQLEFRRVKEALERTAAATPRLVPTERLSPLAFPLWAERLRSQYVSSEKWSVRVQRMAVSLEEEASGSARPKPRKKRRQVAQAVGAD